MIPPYVSAVNNLVKNPCVHATVDEMSVANLTNKVDNMLWTTYYSVAELKNHIDETVNVMDSVYSGHIFQISVAVLNLSTIKE